MRERVLDKFGGSGVNNWVSDYSNSNTTERSLDSNSHFFYFYCLENV